MALLDDRSTAPRGDVQDAAPGQRRHANWLTGSLVLEVTVIVLLFVAYNIVRALPDSAQAIPFAHAHDVLRAEGGFFDHVELPLNRWMSGLTAIAVPACYFYAVFHYAATPFVFVMSRLRGGRRYWRGYWSLILASAIAVAVYALYPTAPPRLVPGLGVVDVMREYAAYGWWGSAASAPRAIGDATNQYAAMPSMHFGWALWCAVQMWGFGGWRWRTAAVLYPSLLVVAVLGTGNHFVLDVVAGGVTVVAAYLLVGWVQRLRERSSVV